MLLLQDWVYKSHGIQACQVRKNDYFLCVVCMCGACVSGVCAHVCLCLLLLNIYVLVKCNWEQPTFNWLNINKHIQENWGLCLLFLRNESVLIHCVSAGNSAAQEEVLLCFPCMLSSLDFYFHWGLIFKNMFLQQNYNCGDDSSLSQLCLWK